MNRLRTILADWLFSLSLVLERWSDAVRPMSETGIPAPYDSIAVTTHEYDLMRVLQERMNEELRKETDRAFLALTTVTTDQIARRQHD